MNDKEYYSLLAVRAVEALEAILAELRAMNEILPTLEPHKEIGAIIYKGDE